MKILLMIFAFSLATHVYGQKYLALEKVLAVELPQEAFIGGKWVFYPDNAQIEKLSKRAIKAVIPNYELYKVTLTNFLDHINQGTCIILFDSLESKIILVPPLWYSGVGESLIKPLMQNQFDSQGILLNSLTEFHELMEIGCDYKFINTGYSDSLITYDLVRFNGDSSATRSNSAVVQYTQDEVWRQIKIHIKDRKIMKYTSINPRMNTEETVQ
jgi:hypothetical protein